MKNPYKKHKKEMFFPRKTAPRQLNTLLFSLTRSDLTLNIFKDIYKQIQQQGLDFDSAFGVKMIANPHSTHLYKERMQAEEDTPHYISLCHREGGIKFHIMRLSSSVNFVLFLSLAHSMCLINIFKSLTETRRLQTGAQSYH